MKRLNKIKKIISAKYKIIVSAFKYIVCCVIPYKSEKRMWVICERGTDARDNGYAFYRYIIDKHPEIKVYYIISPNSADYKKVADNAVCFGSLKNYWVVAKAEKIISTHCYTALPVKSEKLWNLLNLGRKFYFLQHGIIQSKLPYLYGNFTKMQLFCCAATLEYEYVKNNFLHPEGVVLATGLARYDNLLDCQLKKQILVMPTWRRYIKNENEFLNSLYYDMWNDVIADPHIIEYLEKENITLVFYPHYEFQPYLNKFDKKSPNIILADFEYYDVQQLLKESMLLITDYSSVFFDFAYMEKPCIYYQFDQQEYNQKHYQKGYFNVETNGFGRVVKNHTNLVEQFFKTANNSFQMDDMYKERVKMFFAHHDENNCERIYDAIINSK